MKPSSEAAEARAVDIKRPHRVTHKHHVLCLTALVAFWLLVVGPVLSRGQDPVSAVLTGSVRDPSGAAVPGASVKLRHLATQQTRNVVTDVDGSYRIVALAVGDYEMRVQAEGFTPYLNPVVALTLGRTAVLEVTLCLEGVNTQVNVTDEPPAIDITSATSTTSIDPERIAEAPINSRNYLEFTLLAPGVASSRGQATGGSVASSSGPLADSGFTFGGLRPRSNSVSIDGLDNTDETTGAARVALSPEIVREFQVINSGLSAEFGGAAGGTINVITRTGSNDFHGSAFLFLQNEALNARDPLPDGGYASRLRFRRYQPGGALGGPIKRDHVFFYAALEQENLSAEQQPEIDPLVSSRVNAALSSGLAPRLAVRSLTTSFFPVGKDETEAAVKLTYLAGSRHTLNLRAAFTNDRARGNAFNVDALSDPTDRGSAYTKDYQLTGSVLSTLSPRLVNDLRFQVSTRHVVTGAGDPEGPGIEIVGLARFGRPFDADTARRETREQLVENLTLTRSRSEWKAGVTVNHVSLHNEARDGFGGLYIFPTVDAFVLGRPTLWRQAFGEAQTELDVTGFGAFLQNQWRATPHLTLNLGLRYDVVRLPLPFRTDVGNFSPRIGLAWSPSGQWVVRTGFGLYYDRLPLAFLNRAIQKNGTHAFEQVAAEVDATQVFAGAGGGTLPSPMAGITPSAFRADPTFETPYSMQANAEVERLLSRNLTVRAGYLVARGVHLPRTRNVNLLPPVVLTTTNAVELGVLEPTPQQVGRPVFPVQRLDPRLDSIYQLEDAASSTYHGLTLALNKRLSDEWELLASYTLSKTLDDASDFDEQPANPYDLRAERAPSRQDLRQRFVLSALFDLPFGEAEEKGQGRDTGNLLERTLEHIELAPLIALSSGQAVNPLTGSDEERSHAFPLVSRPLGLTRNSLRSPSLFSVDLRAVKYVPFGELRRLDFVVEFFNLFNRRNVAALNPFYGSGAASLSTFGIPVAFALPRQLRLSIDFEF
jgi:outer membrane receptor protein involved in Fe transport